MTSIFNNFESPASGTTLTTGNTSNADGSTAFDAISIGAGGTLVTDTTHVAHGSQALKVASGSTAALTYAQWTSGPFTASNGQAWGRVYCYFTANPSAGFPVAQLLDSSGNGIGRVTINSSGKVVMNYGVSNAVATTSTNAVPLNAWFRLEFMAIASATVGQTEVKLFSSPESTTATETNTSAATLNTGAGPIQMARVGLNGSTANLGPVWLDAADFSNVGYIGPYAVPVAISGSVANITLAAPTGAVAAGVNIAGAVANVALGAPNGAPAAGVTIAGSVANITLGAPTGAVSAGSGGTPVNVLGVTANIALAAPTGSVTSFVSAAVAGATVNVLLQMPAGTIVIIPQRVFRPPTIKLRPADPQGERLWLYYGIDQGISVIKNQDGTYTQQMYPTTDQINAAAFVYMGGHEYPVDDAEYEALVAAGYLEGFEDPLADGGYGDGDYGALGYT